MARTELPNGVILPAEYSDDWYEDMTSNLTKLDDVIGSDSEKLNSNDVAFLRMSSAALTDGGIGNFSDLNSSNKLKTGDYVLDSGRKLYQIVSVDSTNETFTVGNSLFKVTAESDLAPVAESGDYDDLTNKPNYGILRMTSETLSDSGSGAISNLNSDSKLAAGDYVLDAALKVFLITAVSAPNYTVGTSLFQITNASALAAVATSGNYDDLNNLPTYGITRFCSSAISDNSSVAFSNISSTDKIKVGDFLLDTAGKLYQISSVDTANETVSVTTPLTQLAVDSGVMHLSGNESASGDKNFQGLLTTIPNASLWPTVLNTTDDVTYLDRSVIHIEYKSSGQLTDLSGGAWSVAELGAGCFFFRMNNGADIRFKNLATRDVNRIPVVSGSNRFINDVTPNQDNTYDLGSSSLRWRSINGINPSALSMPDLDNGIDISGYITIGNTDNNYTPPANGWIWIRLIGNGAAIIQGDFGINANYVSDNLTQEKWVETNLFVTKNVQATIRCRGITGIVSAKFYPCLGNV